MKKSSVTQTLEEWIDLVFPPTLSLIRDLAQTDSTASLYGIATLFEITRKRLLKITELIEKNYGSIEVELEWASSALAGEILAIRIGKETANE